MCQWKSEPSKGDREDITIKCGFSSKLDRGATDFYHNLHFACKQCRVKNTCRNTTAAVSEGLKAPADKRENEKKDKKTMKIKKWEGRGGGGEKKKKAHANKKKRVAMQQGDGQDGILWDITFHKTLGSTSTS